MSHVEKIQDYIDAHSDENTAIEDILLTIRVHTLTMLDILGAE